MAPTANKHNQHQQKPGLPDPAHIVKEVEFTTQQQAAGGGVLQPAKIEKFRIITTTEMDAYDNPLPLPAEGAEAPALAALPPVPVGEDYQGKARKAAKLSISPAPVENLSDLQDLINSLPSIAAMTNHTPPITEHSARVDEEERNVQLQAFLYYAKRETDNDFHLIIGRDPNLEPYLYMTMELSGLPTSDSPSYDALKASRDAFEQYFGANLPGMSYVYYDPPRPVQIQGSLFFDITHATGGHPGPPSLQPYMPTIWEVHPITSIILGAQPAQPAQP